MENPPRKNVRIALILIFLIDIVWGSQYLLIKLGVQDVPVFFFQGFRFLIAFLGFLPFFGKFRLINKQTVIASLILAFILYVMTAFLTYGLEYTSSSKGAFIATLYVVMTPPFARLILGRHIQRNKWVGVAFAIGGMFCMMLLNPSSGLFDFSINLGDVLIFVCAALNAVQIVLMEKYVKSVDIMLFSLLQLGLLSLFLLTSSFVLQESVNLAGFSPTLWWVIIYLGIAGGTCSLLIQSYGQKYIEASRAAILFTLEPVFGTFFSVVFGHEPLTIYFIIGASLIFAGILLSSIEKRPIKVETPPEEKKDDSDEWPSSEWKDWNLM